MRASVSATTLRRVKALEELVAQPPTQRGGYLVVPEMLSLDDWQMRARAYYASRVEEEAEDRAISDANDRLRRETPISNLRPLIHR